MSLGICNQNKTNYFLLTGLALALIISTSNCRKTEIRNIKIGEALSQNISLKDYKILTSLIESSINSDENGIRKLVNFNCGDGESCYDLGFIIVQIIEELGEIEFSKKLLSFRDKEKLELRNLLDARIEYGLKSNEKIEEIYPIIDWITANEWGTLINSSNPKLDIINNVNFMWNHVEYQINQLNLVLKEYSLNIPDSLKIRYELI